MSDRNINRGDDRRGNGGFRGGYGNRGAYGNGHRSGGYVKINQDDVPESRHSIFIRGLPSNLDADEIMDFFDDHIGRCSIEYKKVNYERESLFVAIRFETKEEAKKAYNKYRYEDILCCRCEVTWFRDIRRYIAHQQQNGLLPRGSSGRGRGFHSNHHKQDNRKRRYSEVEDRRSRSESESDRRSRSRSSDESDSSRSRSRSVRSSSRESERRRSRSREEKREEKKKEKKVNKSKRFNPQSESRIEVGRSKWERSRSNSLSDGDDTPPPKKKNDKEVRPFSRASSPIALTSPPAAPIIIKPILSSIISTPESSADQHSDSICLPSDVDLEGSTSSLPVEIQQTEMAEPTATFETITEPVISLYDSPPREKPNPPPPLPPMVASISPSSPTSQSPLEGSKGEEKRERCPLMTNATREMKEFQHDLISSVHLYPSLQTASSSEELSKSMEERETKINNLNRMQKHKLETKMKKMFKTYTRDAQLMTTMINSVVQKDASLEEKIKPALLAFLEDLEEDKYKEIDDFLDFGL